MFDLYPYTNFHELNQDWILGILKKFENELKQAIDYKTIHYADPLQWNIITQYAPNTVVVDENTGIAYISKDAVPSGILLSDSNYWMVIFDYQKIYNKIMTGIAYNEKDSETANKDLLVNDLVWYHGDLYRVTKSINIGGRFIINGNIISTSIENLLSNYYGRERISQLINDTLNVSGDYTVNAGDIAETSNNRTEKVAVDREIDVDGNDSIHVDGNDSIHVDGNDSIHVGGTTTINRGGSVNEVNNSNRDLKVIGTNTETYEDTNTTNYKGKKIINAKDIDITAKSALIHFPTKTIDLATIGELTSFIDVTSCDEYGLESIGFNDDPTEMTRKFQAILNFATDSKYVVYIPGELELNITKVVGTRIRYILSYGSINGDIDLNYDSTQRIAQWYQINAVYGTITLRGFKSLTMFINYADTFKIEGLGNEPTLMSTAYCAFYMQTVKNFIITGNNKGWVNENKFYNLRCENLTIESTDADYHHNHNIFYGFVFEHTNVNIKQGSFNIFHDCRVETAGATDNSLTIGSTCYDNTFYRSWYSSPSPFYDILQSGITVDDKSRETFFLNSANQAIKNFFIYNLSPDNVPSGMTYENNKYTTSAFINKVIGNLTLNENIYITISGRFGIQLYDVNHNKYSGELDSHIHLGRGLKYSNGFISIATNVSNYNTAILIEKGVGTYYGEIVMYIAGQQTIPEFNLIINKKYNLVTQ
jgi:hypothetical protein